MNPTEKNICDEILNRYNESVRMNQIWLELIWWNNKSSKFIELERSWLYRKEYKILDYLDGRKNLIDIPRFCSETGYKIDKKRMKWYLKNKLWQKQENK